MLIPQVMSAGFKCSNVLFRIRNWSCLASKVRKGLELEPYWPRGARKRPLPDVRFHFCFAEVPRLGGIGFFCRPHSDPPSSSSRSRALCESKGDPSIPWFLCRTLKSNSSFTSAEVMTTSSKSGTQPVVRWLFPFIIREHGTFYSFSPPGGKSPCRKLQ